ncbi:MAG: formylmethanofuran dehydrogenase subunit E family protein [Deltaproteobacteria bacterium]|nr:formylmethanofuran dehydrogenase subunit E family protein [Deltaproteobacteria bacterium]
MKETQDIKFNLPEDLKKCIEFHGHLCPGLVYGYLVAKEAMSLLKLKRSKDEEVVAISENDSCAVDALQILLGRSARHSHFIRHGNRKRATTP